MTGFHGQRILLELPFSTLMRHRLIPTDNRYKTLLSSGPDSLCAWPALSMTDGLCGRTQHIYEPGPSLLFGGFVGNLADAEICMFKALVWLWQRRLLLAWGGRISQKATRDIAWGYPKAPLLWPCQSGE